MSSVQGLELAESPSRLPIEQRAAERLRPIAAGTLMAIFRQRLGTQIEGAFREITRRMAAEAQR